MKKVNKVISFLLAFIMLFTSTSVYASTKTRSRYTGITYTHNSKFKNKELVYGMDVSQHNGKINFKKAKRDGIEFVFIRVGYTGYTKSSFSLNLDKKYKTYIKDATKAGLKVGVYWYSQSTKVSEAKKEAKALLKAIKGYSITMPVVFDYEFADTKKGRLDSAKLSKTNMTANALAFLNTVSNAGYDACIYASENFLGEHLYANQISSSFKVWLANYSSKTNYKGDYEFWQHTAKGRVSGMRGNVDINFWYKGENSTYLGTQIYTGSPIECGVYAAIDGRALVENVDYTLTYSNNVNVGTAHITLNGIGEHKGLKQNYTFDIVPDKVKKVWHISSENTSLKLSWDSVLGANAYVITAESINNFKTFTKTVYGRTEGEIDGLIEGNEYIVTVRALGYDSKGNALSGEPSDYISTKTTGNKVSGVKVSARAEKSITLSWYRIADCESYTVYQYDSALKEYKPVGKTDGNTNSLKISNLKQGLSYKFTVCANKENRQCEPSDAFSAVTVPKKVSNKSAKSKKSRRITYSFKKVNATGYQYQWSTHRNFKSNFLTKNTKSTKVTIKTAQSRRRYYVRVRAYKTEPGGKKIYGKWSNVKSVKVK
jgi:GH25 family lysozyme M1 (1,4-beta-N-acetylmuramidase)